MSTIKISDLATSAISLTDFIVKAGATGIATKNTVQGISDVINANNTLFKETIAIADIPSENGWYFASESGTYTNCGGLVINTTDNIAIIIVSGTFDTFKKIDIPVNITIDAIPTEGSANAVESGGVDSLVRNVKSLVSGKTFFTLGGFTNNTGNYTSQTGSDNRTTDYIELTVDNFLDCTLLTAVSIVRQAVFFSDKTEGSFISTYTADNNKTIALSSSNIPAGTKYVRLNANIANGLPVLKYDSIKSNKNIVEDLALDTLDSENTYKMETGVDLFTVTGYVKSTDGTVGVDANYKCTDYLKLNSFNKIDIRGLSIGGIFRQASFFTTKDSTSLISSYTDNDLSDIILNESNIPSTTRYIRFSKLATNESSLELRINKYKSLPILREDNGAYDSINATSGYSGSYGRYWDSTNNQFVNNNSFYGSVTEVVAGQVLKIRGNCDSGNNAIAVFFSDADLTTHVANGTYDVINGNKFYEIEEIVPAGAHTEKKKNRFITAIY